MEKFSFLIELYRKWVTFFYEKKNFKSASQLVWLKRKSNVLWKRFQYSKSNNGGAERLFIKSCRSNEQSIDFKPFFAIVFQLQKNCAIFKTNICFPHFHLFAQLFIALQYICQRFFHRYIRVAHFGVHYTPTHLHFIPCICLDFPSSKRMDACKQHCMFVYHDTEQRHISESGKKLTKFMRRGDFFSDYVCWCCSTENRIITILRDFVALLLTGETLHTGTQGWQMP